MRFIKYILLVVFAGALFWYLAEVSFATNTWSGHFNSASSSYANNTVSNPYEVTTTFSIAFWVYPISWPAADNSFMASKFSSGNNDCSWQIRYDTQGGGTKITVTVCDDGEVNADELSFTHVLTTTQWTHIAWTWKGGATKEFKWYINCNLLSSQTGANVDIMQNKAGASQFVTLAARNAGLFYTGLLDDVQIYNTVLTQSYINGICTSAATERVGTEDGQGNTGNARNGLMAYYKMNGDWNDSNGLTTTHHLTAVNSPVFSPLVPFGDAPAAVSTPSSFPILMDW